MSKKDWLGVFNHMILIPVIIGTMWWTITYFLFGQKLSFLISTIIGCIVGWNLVDLIRGYLEKKAKAESKALEAKTLEAQNQLLKSFQNASRQSQLNNPTPIVPKPSIEKPKKPSWRSIDDE